MKRAIEVLCRRAASSVKATFKAFAPCLENISAPRYTEAMNQFSYGVLDDAGLHFLQNERWRCVPVRGAAHAGEVLALALEHQLARIRLTPGSALSDAFTADE